MGAEDFMFIQKNDKSIKAFLLGICTLLMFTSCNKVVPSENSSDKAKSDNISSKITNTDDVVINFAVLGKADYITSAAKKFNEADNGYRIELIDYYNESDDSASRALQLQDFQIMQDIINTDDIDMVTSLSFSEEANYRRLIEKGAFTDLYEFMQNDTEVNTTTLNDHILSVNEMNGCLFTIPTYYVAYTMLGDSAYVGNKINWSFDELFSHWEKMPDNATIMGERTKEAAYRAFVAPNLSSFVDFESGNVNFDSDDFRKALEFCNKFEYGNQEKTDIDFNAPMFCNEASISSFMGIYPYKLGSNNPNATFVGFPSSNGEGAYLRSFSDCFSISAKSSEEKQQGAWEFIRLFFLTEWQEEHALSITNRTSGYATQQCFCINNTANENIKRNTVDKKYSPATFESKGETFTTEFPSLEDCNALESYLNSIDRWEVRLDDSIVGVIDEEVMTYFSDEISIDECINRIQNRTSIWISEKS